MKMKERRMKPEEAIELLRSMQNPKQDYADIVCAPAFCTGFRFVYPEPEDYAIEEAIKALKEIQQYREIGTVEECRKAVDKQKRKKIIIEPYCSTECPTCGHELSTSLGDGYYKYPTFLERCPNCGQAILW